MPLNLDRAGLIAQDTSFRIRVGVAFAYVAQEVFLENPSTTYHQNRITFAQRVVSTDVVVDYQRYATMVVLDPEIVGAGTALTTAASIPDSDIIRRVRNMWTYLSGVIPGAGT